MDNLIWGLLIGVLIFLVAIDKFGLLEKLKSPGSSSLGFPYVKSKQLLTNTERSFFGALGQAVAGQYVILCKVRMEDAIYVPTKTENRQAYRNRIKSRHLDFLLCRPDTLEPALAIELDDRSHLSARGQKADAFKSKALRAAGLPLMRVPVRRGYDTLSLASGIATMLGQ